MSNSILSRVGFKLAPNKSSQFIKLANACKTGGIKSPDDLPMKVRQGPDLEVSFKFRDPDKLNAGEEDLIKSLLDYFKYCDDALRTDNQGPMGIKALKMFLKGKEQTRMGTHVSVTFGFNHLKTPDEFKNYGKYAYNLLENLKTVVNVGTSIDG